MIQGPLYAQQPLSQDSGVPGLPKEPRVPHHPRHRCARAEGEEGVENVDFWLNVWANSFGPLYPDLWCPSIQFLALLTASE